MKTGLHWKAEAEAEGNFSGTSMLEERMRESLASKSVDLNALANAIQGLMCDAIHCLERKGKAGEVLLWGGFPAHAH